MQTAPEQPQIAPRPEITTWSATEIARRIRQGDITTREAVTAHIARITAVNPQLNAVVVPLFEQALQAADASDARRAKGEMLGPLDGAPITIKDCLDVAGTPSTGGLTARARHQAARDSLLVERLRAAGAIILGKTNVPQLLLYPETDNPLYGRTNNPWNLARSPGGSSGGEGAIIAAGGSALGMGTDIGGSIRTPAHFCGIHGLKPTSRRLSLQGSFDELLFPGMEGIVGQPGPLARSVADLRAAFAILAAPGQEARDLWVTPAPLGDPGAVDARSLRIGYYEDDTYFPASPAIRRAAREAAEALRAYGAVVEPFTPPDLRHAMDLYFGFLFAGGTAWAAPLFAGGKRDKRIGDLVRISQQPRWLNGMLGGIMQGVGQKRFGGLVRGAGQQTAAEYMRLVAAANAYRQRFAAALDAQRIDALICPPLGFPALTHGASYYLSGVLSHVMLFNLLGMPAGVVAATRVRPGEESDRPRSGDLVEKTARRVEQDSAGLPVGVQVAARHWREDIALAVMQVLEDHFRAQPDYPAQPPL